ncbi:hypothetical protein TNCV_1134801 [Trichonephila clavipes]|nr:hypothetical protein TNCV_1134801 [Trichonephila clavipes]
MNLEESHCQRQRYPNVVEEIMYVKSVETKFSRWDGVEVWRRRLQTQVLSSSIDGGSKLRNQSRIALSFDSECDAN